MIARRWRTSLVVPVMIIAVVIGLVGAAIVHRQGQDPVQAVLAGTNVDQGTLPVTVPYRSVAGAIVIDVTLGDAHDTVPMILDTGAPTIISAGTAQVLASDGVGAIAGVSADSQVVTRDVVRLPRLAIGDAVFHDVGAVVGAIEPGDPFRCITDSGFIGANLMQAAAWQIDPQAQEVTIAGSVAGLEHIDSAFRLDLTRAADVSPSPLIELAVGEGSLRFLVDTGSDGWLAVNPADLDRIGVELPEEAPTVAVLGSGAAGAFTTRARWTGTDVALGGRAMPLPIAAMAALPEGQGNAGMDFLSRFVVTIDWADDALYLEPIEALTPTVPRSAGLAWDEGYVVGSLVEDAPDNEDLVLGAAVSAIDGRDVSRATFDDFCAHLVEAPARYEMTVDGEAPVTLEVAPLEGFYESLAG